MIYEKESTIKLKITEETFLKFQKKNNWHHDVIINYNNGARLSTRRYECKKTLSKDRIAVFHNKCFYPITRTNSTEEPLGKSTLIGSIVKGAIRYFNVTTPSADDSIKYVRMRQSVNKAENVHGVMYFLASEIEYNINIEYEEMLQVEHFMLETNKEFIHEHMATDALDRDDSCKNDMFISTAPKIQMWSQFNVEESYKWAYKWNGIKAKMMIKDGVMCLWPDSMPIKTHTFSTKNDNPYDFDIAVKNLGKINFQVEIMPTSIIIVHVLSVSYQKKVHLIDPYSSIDFLDFLRIKLPEIHVNFITLDESSQKMRLRFQRFFNPPKCNTFNQEKYDGFILVQRSMFIKWKQPTIDARFLGGSLFEVGNGNNIIQFRLQSGHLSECKKDKIYEISSDLKILRHRIDRLFCSTYKEYQMFINSIAQMT